MVELFIDRVEKLCRPSVVAGTIRAERLAAQPYFPLVDLLLQSRYDLGNASSLLLTGERASAEIEKICIFLATTYIEILTRTTSLLFSVLTAKMCG